ncbi:MAG: MFS transporter [Tepidisphaeraceae bacterium]|jgi:GPH family glycoside/pentoside/hexuronide:cation symporter
MAQILAATNPISQPRDRIPVLTKIAYSLGTALDMWGLWLYPGVAFAVFNIYLGVKPELVGLALTLIRVYDAISDPVVGWISDNFRSKYGRRRPFILVSGILCGLGLPALFLVSPHWSDIQFLHVSAVFWYMLFSSMIYIPIFSTFTVPYNSLANELTPDYEERTSLMTYKSAIQKIFEIGNFYGLRFTTLAWFLVPGTHKTNTLLGVQVYTSILGALMAIFAIIMFFSVKERYYETIVVKTTERVPLRSSFYETLKCQPFRMMMCMGGAFTLGTSMVGTLGLYATIYYVCAGNTDLGYQWNFWMGIAYMIGGFIGAPALNRVAYFIGKRAAVIVAACIGILGFGGSWYLYTPAIPWLQTVASGTMAFAGAGLWMLSGSIGADVIDYDELTTGKRREGSFTGCAQYIFKLGNSGGSFLAGLILTWVGFKSSLGAQSPHTVFWIRAMLASIPVAGLLLVIFFILRVPLTKKICQEIRTTLEARRGKV